MTAEQAVSLFGRPGRAVEIATVKTFTDLPQKVYCMTAGTITLKTAAGASASTAVACVLTAGTTIDCFVTEITALGSGSYLLIY
jgi:hypothetical protein